MTSIRSAFIVPALIFSASFIDSHVVTAKSSSSIETALASESAKSNVQQSKMKFVLARKERIQKVLLALDRIAQTTTQMKPETADRIEPVIVDLAEQTIDLSNERALQLEQTDQSLLQIETTVGELARTMSRYVEPEASL